MLTLSDALAVFEASVQQRDWEVETRLAWNSLITKARDSPEHNAVAIVAEFYAQLKAATQSPNWSTLPALVTLLLFACESKQVVLLVSSTC